LVSTVNILSHSDFFVNRLFEKNLKTSTLTIK